MNFSERVLEFYQKQNVNVTLPQGIEVLNPYKNIQVVDYCKLFYNKYFNDTKGRILILGINPGRFGAGITGIPFTDPVVLEEECGIKNNFKKRGEISSEFVYKLINRLGGPGDFYKHFYIGSVSPLGYIKDGKNYNYYDSRDLEVSLKKYIVQSLIGQIGLGINSRKCYCLGMGKNYDYLTMLNIELKLFDSIIPLPHPRWVMQYRRKNIDEILDQMVGKLIT